MKLTQEQSRICNSKGDIKINAVAGSGKTTTIIEYAGAQSPESKILYLAFNRAVKLEARKRFKDRGLANVRVETAHSLAYQAIVLHTDLVLKASGYHIHEIADVLRLKVNHEKHTEYIIANHINKFISYYCNSTAESLKELNYLEVISDPAARDFVSSFYKYIEKHTMRMLAMMEQGSIPINHDYYLKRFQMSKPVLDYDVLLFDEGQDASSAMLDVFFNQRGTRVIVGDIHQQIYGWRFAVNSLQKANFKNLYLSTSFRFSQDIADLAMAVLSWKQIIGVDTSLKITGSGTACGIKTKAVIARTNLGLLLKAIEFISTESRSKRIYFEGHFNSYTYADEGASLYDVLHLYNNKRRYIRDKLIRKMSSMKELEEYIDKSDDGQLAMMVDIVKEYKNRIPGLIREIKRRHLEPEERNKASMIFSTVHRCKGMEYDLVHIVDDFITADKLEMQVKGGTLGQLEIDKLNEEINLLYVAITRTRNRVEIPESLIPEGVLRSEFIRVLEAEHREATAQ
ncbi:ATP-dependent helicase [bacterium]|nr:ATP-dependent helicase [bacterium]